MGNSASCRLVAVSAVGAATAVVGTGARGVDGCIDGGDDQGRKVFGAMTGAAGFKGEEASHARVGSGLENGVSHGADAAGEGGCGAQASGVEAGFDQTSVSGPSARSDAGEVEGVVRRAERSS